MENKKEIKPETMPEAVKAQAIEEGRKRLENGLTTEEKFSSVKQAKPEDDSKPKLEKSIVDDKPLPLYDPPVSTSTPKAKGKEKGRSI